MPGPCFGFAQHNAGPAKKRFHILNFAAYDLAPLVVYNNSWSLVEGVSKDASDGGAFSF